MPADPMKLENLGEYSPRKFYVRATNKHDHSLNCQTPFPKEVLAEVKRIAELVPEYKGSPQAFIRDAVFHRLHQLEDQGFPINQGLLQVQEMLAEQEGLREYAKTLRLLVTEAEATFDDLFEVGAVAQYQDVLRLVEDKMLENIDPAFRPDLEKVVAKAKSRLKLLRGGVDE